MDSDDDETFGNVARLSSNNPYRNVGSADTSTGFLTFPARSPSTASRVRRTRTTYVTPPVQIDELEAAFQEEATPRPSKRRANSLASSVFPSQFTTYDVQENAVEYSDTARLTAHMAGDNDSDYDNNNGGNNNNTTMPPAPEPARVTTDKAQNRQSINRVATVIRKVSRRVVNVQNDRVPIIDTQPPFPAIPSVTEDAGPEEAIPLTPKQSSSNDAAENTTPDPQVASERQPGLHLAGKSCGVFGPHNKLRKALASIILWSWTETIMMLVIALHAAVLLAVGWGTTSTPEPPQEWGQTWDQFVLLAIYIFYTLSVICRIIVYGFLFTPKDPTDPPPPLAFMRHSWNRIDFISVCSYWIDLALLCNGVEIIGDTIRILVFKCLSALILVRLLNITDGNRVILQSLRKAGPLVLTVSSFVLFFFVIFAIVGVQSFQGSFLRRCVWTNPNNSTDTQIMQQYCGGYMENGVVQPFLSKDGESGPWAKGFICPEGLVCQEVENPYGNTISFDNIFASMLIVVIIAGNQSWTDLMYNMMDAEYVIASLYFIVIVIVLNFWLINLFVAVINEMFAKVREDSAQHSAFMSSRAKPVLADEGEGWAFRHKRLAQTNRWRSTLFRDIVRITRPLWVIAVAADLIVMGLKNNDMTPQQLNAIDTAELYFSIAFFVEIILRFLAEWPQWRKFFGKRSNRADTFIAVVTCTIRIPPIHDHRAVYAWLTVFQVLRIYRIIVVIPRVRTLSARVLGSVWGLINLMFFIILATLLVAIMSYQLFEGLLNDSEDEMRFFSIYNSFAALYQLFSGENWTDVLYDIMEAGVPSKTVAINALFLVFWFLFSNFVLVNMFIAVLMENFEIVEEEKKKRQLEEYVKRTEHDMEEDPVISRWNIYRYFRPHPKGLNVNIPANLVWQAKKDVVRDFMVDDTTTKEVDDERKALLGDIARHQHLQTQSGWKAKIQALLRKATPSVQPLPITGTRKSMTLDSKNPLEQFQTFFDKGNRLGAREQQSLQQILLHSSSADPMHSGSHMGMDEATLHNLEERKALRQEFIAAHPTYDKSLYIFSVNNRIRRWCQLLVPPSRGERFFGAQPSLVASWIFYGFISCSIVVTVILTIYNSPVYQFEHRNDPAHLMIFEHLDWAFTIIFSIEFVIKIIADGFLLAPNAYMLNGWNILDLFVLVTLYLSNFNSFASSTGLERAFRAFKALRALRLINLLRPAREMFTAIMVKGLPYIADAACLCICIIIPFALYGQNVFQGLFYSCNDDSSDITNKSLCVNEAMLGTDAPMPDDTEIYQPRIWDNPYVYSFDSFAKGLLLLVEITSGEGWTDVQAASMSIVGKDQAPKQDASQLAGVFFMVYNLIGSILVIALFLGVVLENFSRRNGTAYLTAEQRRWMDLKKLLSRMRPAKRPKKVPSSGIRKKCFDLVVEKRGRFYKFMIVVIVLNILFLCTESDLDTTTVTIARTYTYLGFLAIYWTEITVKLLGLGWASFRRNLWNLFDLVAVSGSTITVIAALGTDVQKMSVEAQKLFMTAICFKLVQRSDSLNQLFTIIAASAYQILNVFAVWFVVMTTYAIMFMEIFGLTKYGTQSSTEYVNFRNYANTMISLVRYSSGEGWNTVMHDFAVEYPNCVQADDYLFSDCGSTSWAYFLFISFNIISMYIFVAIFVAVVSDNFSYVYQIASNFSLVNRDEIRKFKKVWADIDRDRTGYIEPKDYIAFWRRLGGVFRTRLYDPEFSYKELTSQCALNVNGPTVMDDPYQVRIDINILNRRLAALDKATIHQRKVDLNMLFWEAALIEGPKGVSFNQMLLLIARRKLIIPENALLLEELFSTRKREETVQTLIKIDRVKGMIETIALRKAFLRHLENKRLRKSIPNVPSIVVDQKRLSRPFNLMELYSAPATPVTPLAGERGFFTEDRDSMSPTSPDISPIEDTTVDTKLWQDMLQKEGRL